MARFKYKGEPARVGVTYGPCVKIRLRLQDGTLDELVPEAPATEFAIDEDIGYDIVDPRCIRHLRGDPRFEEIV